MTTSEKKTRGMVQHVMHRAGILEGTWNIPGQYKINVERLNTITDMELAHVKGCGDVILDYIHRFRDNINKAMNITE